MGLKWKRSAGQHMNAFYYFIQSIPECVGVIALSLAVARIPLRWGRILIGGIFISILTYIIRSLPITFGFHLPICIFVIFLLIVKLTNVSPSRTIIAVFTSFFTLALLEYIISTAFFAYSHMTPKQALANQGLWASLGIGQAVILNIIALIVVHFLKPIEGAWKK